MADSQKFPVAAHALAYLAHKDAFASADAISSSELAASIPTNPVVVRRVTAMLAKAGLVGTRPGAGGGTWLLVAPNEIPLDKVMSAVGECAHLGQTPTGASGCPVGERIPAAVDAAMKSAGEAATARLRMITVADLLTHA